MQAALLALVVPLLLAVPSKNSHSTADVNADYVLCMSGKNGQEVLDACTRVTWVPAYPRSLVTDVYLARAFARVSMGGGLSALSDCRKALFELQRDLKDGRAHNCFAWVYLHLRQYELGLTWANRAVLTEPANVFYRSNRAQLYEALGNIPKAIVDFRHAVVLDPTQEKNRKALERLRLKEAPAKDPP